ncbi:tyrosine-type recombinase/integrase [Rhizobium sp. FKL33]|uniref:tyrosine-type recombinase/integrase n=1 Tax=Rhizobium sp. FKL33 TaxID=2562307 RepID=UPI0010C03918|nr:tyrosine-type recombinase/integrase [Rhizobium sp. FKL33]
MKPDRQKLGRHIDFNRGQYRARIIVPVELRPFVLKKDGTPPCSALEEYLGADPREALKRSRPILADFDRQLSLARKHYEASRPTVSSAAKATFATELEFDLMERAIGPRQTLRNQDRIYSDKLRLVAAGIVTDEEAEALIGYAAEDLIARGLADASTPTKRAELLKVLANVRLDALAVSQSRDKGEVYPPDARTPELLQPAPEPLPPIVAPSSTKRPALTFEGVIKEQERITALGLRSREKAPATLTKYRKAIEEFEIHRGSKEVATVTLAQGEAWRDDMLTAGKLSRKTIHDKITAIRTVLSWAHKQHKGELFPAGLPLQFLDLPVVERQDSADRTYSLKEARHLLEFARTATRSSFRWIPWIIAHTGARVNEITPLEKADIIEVEGHWFIHIRVGDGRTTKTHKARKVPVHNGLIKEGFIEWVKAQPAGRLFPGGKNEDQRIREWIHEKVFPNRDDMPPPNHGFRHLFEDALFSGVSHKAALYITGRSSGSSADDYGGSDLKLLGLAEEMDKVRDIITANAAPE